MSECVNKGCWWNGTKKQTCHLPEKHYLECEWTIQQAKLARAEEAVRDAVKSFGAESVQGSGDYYNGLCCGLEDHGITDRYEAMSYGYERALERVQDEVIAGLEEALAATEGIGE